jgi:Zn-dependent protease
MSLTTWPVPFIINPQNLAVDSVTSFVVAALLAIMINAEAQAFVATFLGDARQAPKDRFHFNVFLHLDILGTVCYLVGGFGWPRTMPVDPGKFKHPRLYTAITRLAGPAANLTLAGIGGSLALVMKSFAWDPRVFLMVIGVNITTAVFNLIPLPPLAGGWVVHEMLPDSLGGVKSLFLLAGPYAIIALTLWERVTGQDIFSHYFVPTIQAIFKYTTS